MIILFILLAYLCWTDLRERRINNFITIPATIIACCVFNTWIEMLIVFGLMSLFYNQGRICGGDVKLSAMVAAFLGYEALIIIAGTALLIKCYRMVRDYYRPLPVAPFILICVTAEYLIKQCCF